MKRILLCLIITIIVALLSACDVDEEPLLTELTTPSATEEPVVAPTYMPTPSPTPESTPEPTPHISEQDFSAAGVYPIEADTIYNIDLYNDGTLDTFEIHRDSEAYDIRYGESKILINDDVFEADEMDLVQFVEAHFMRRDDGRVALIISMRGNNDWGDTWIYSFEDGKPKNIPTGHLAGFFSVYYKDLTLESVQLYGTRLVLTNLKISIDAKWNDDFTIYDEDDGWFDVVECPVETFAAKIDFAAERKVGDEYIADTFRAGMSFVPTQVRANQVKIDCTDGSRWTLTFERGEEYGRLIGGVPDYDAIDGVMYMG